MILGRILAGVVRLTLLAVMYIATVGLATVALAQQQPVPSDVMNMFGTMMNAMASDAQRQQARDEWAEADRDLIRCLYQRYSLSAKQLGKSGIGPDDPRIRAQVNACNHPAAVQQPVKQQPSVNPRQSARDAWAQFEPAIIECIDRNYSSTVEQLTERGLGPRYPGVAPTVNRCIRTAENEHKKAEDREITKKQEIIRKEKEKRNEAARVAAEIRRKQIEAASAAEAEKKKKELQTQLASNPKLNFLGLGGAEDLIAIVNIGPKAPHAVVDLHGKLTFTGGSADICFGRKTELSPIEARLYNEELLADKVELAKQNIGRCDNADQIEAIDVLLLRRAEILQGSISNIDTLVNGLSSEKYIKGFVITAEEVKGTREKREVELSSLESAIKNGTKKGYGVIVVVNDGGVLCNTAAELAKIFPDLSRDLMTPKDFEKIDLGKLQIAEVDTDAAFISIKKQKCRAVFGNADSLSTLMAGLNRDHISYTLDGRWISDETIVAYQQGKSDQEKRHLQDEAEARQKVEATNVMRERQAAVNGKINAEQQQALRTANGPRVAALKSEFAKDTEEFLRSSSQGAGATHLGKLYPALAQWYEARLSEGWELDSVPASVEVLDYGITMWKGRSLEALVVTSTINTRHRTLGEYRHTCYTAAYINDVEFGMLREPLVVISCDDEAKTQLDNWKAGFDFKTKWNSPSLEGQRKAKSNYGGAAGAPRVKLGQAPRMIPDCRQSDDKSCGSPSDTGARAHFRSVSMEREGGTYYVRVVINNAITLKFVVDSGASDVAIPADVVSTLIRAGTINKSDFIGVQTYTLADGSSAPSPTFRIKMLKVGDVVLGNVTASISPVDGPLLLGQSFLGRFKSWSIDNASHSLVLQ